jgi:Zn-dependent metalloprotease
MTLSCSPICQAVPPHILRRIAANGSGEQREWALSTLAQDASVRVQRVYAALATTPRLAHAARLTDEGAQRSIYDGQNSESLPGALLRAEDQPASADVSVNEAYDGLGATYDFYHAVYARNSIDDESLPLRATVHYGDHYDNAFWNGTQMVFGDGDGELFNRFTVSLDVIGHELTHGVTEDEAQLAYLNQSGALNESISDVFGSLVKQYSRKQSAEEADWLIGEGLLAASVHGVALRSMKAPGTAFDDPVLGKDDQPAHMDGYVRTNADNGGVHTNSGIPNHAFYLAAVAIGGYAWEKAGRIWYDSLRDSALRPNSSFRSFAAITVRHARQTFTASEGDAVSAAWRQVGISV